jgi:hypothetical protein
MADIIDLSFFRTYGVVLLVEDCDISKTNSKKSRKKNQGVNNV